MKIKGIIMMLMLALFLTACGSSSEVVNVYNWGEYIDPDRLYQISGYPISTVPCLTKYLWFKDNEPESFAGTVRISSHQDYLLREEGLLFAGDHMMEGISVVILPPSGDLKDFIHSLELVTDPQPLAYHLQGGSGTPGS